MREIRELETQSKAPDITLGELLGISKGQNLAFLKSYFDESYSHPKSNPNYLFVGGCTLDSQHWSLLEPQWRTVLNQFGVSAYRSSDLNASKGEFIGWDGIRKDQFRLQLIEALKQSWPQNTMYAVTQWIGIDRRAFDNLYSRYLTIPLTDYELCMLLCVNGSRGAITHLRGDHTIGLFFEEGQDVRPHVRKMLRDAQGSQSKIVDISFVDKVGHMPLQVADMVATEAWRSHTQGISSTFMALQEITYCAGIFLGKENIRTTLKGLTGR